MRRHVPPLLQIAGIILVLALGACTQQSDPKPAKKNGSPRPAHLVEIHITAQEQVSSAHQRTGSLRARRTVRIHSQEEGRVVAAPLFEGDMASQDDTLIRLADDLLEAELDRAKATTRQAGVDLKRIQGLIKKRAASADELARAQTALDVALADQKLLQTRLGYTRILAPFTGVVTERMVEPGDVVSKHSHLLTLADPGSLVTEIHVSELLLPHLHPDDPAVVQIDALGNRRFQGRILRIHPELDQLTRQGVVEVVLDPVPEGARSGQFARVTLTTAQVERLLIPFAAVRRDREGEFVYLLQADSTTHRQPIRSGIRLGDRIEILEGLKPGQQVVSRGFLGLTEGKKVKAVNAPGATAETEAHARAN
jgi:RND family efflux transporter MFP subunit